MKIQTAIIGAGFAKAAYLPALKTLPTVEVVALASARIASARATAEEFDVPYAYDDWRKMLEEHPVDFVGIATPTSHHAAMALAALHVGAHVLCEKPMAMNASEARQMLDTAASLKRIHIVGHELRFNPNRRKIRSLIAEGAIGQVRHVNIVNITPSWGDPATRPTGDWWSMDESGGGRLGANGSHQIDLLRFWLGDIGAVIGQVATMVPNRKDKMTGADWVATGDDQFSFTAEMKNGALASVFVSSVARHNIGNSVQIFGSEGTIKLADADEKLLLARVGEDFQDVSETDPNAALPAINKGIWNVSVVAMMQEVTTAIIEKRPLKEGATFADGLKCQEAMDAIRRSSRERRWMNLN